MLASRVYLNFRSKRWQRRSRT